MEGWIVIALVLSPVVAWQGWKWSRRRRFRREGVLLAAVARERGWTYADDDDRLLSEFAGRMLNADARNGRHYVSGEHEGGRTWVAFDLELITITTSRGITLHTPRDRTVVAMRMPRSSASFQIVPENSASRGLSRVLGTDIELELERFNQAFTVTARDRWFAVQVLTPDNMERLLANPDVRWNCHEDWLAVVLTGRLRSYLDQLEDHLELLDAVIRDIPPFAWRPPPSNEPGRHRR